MNAFDKWFKLQFGKQPGSNKSHATLRQEMEDAEYKFYQAKQVVIDREEWDGKYQAALYAKQIDWKKASKT